MNNKNRMLTTAFTYNLFEDAAAHTGHADAQRKLVTESPTELQHLQLGGVTHALQSHDQQSADACGQTNTRKTSLA